MFRPHLSMEAFIIHLLKYYLVSVSQLHLQERCKTDTYYKCLFSKKKVLSVQQSREQQRRLKKDMKDIMLSHWCCGVIQVS